MVTTIDRADYSEDKDKKLYAVTRIYIIDDKSESLSSDVLTDNIILEDMGQLLSTIRSTGARIKIEITSV